MTTGYEPDELHTVARSPIRKCVYVALERRKHAHDLPAHYRKLHEEYGIKMRMAQRMNDVARGLCGSAIDALDQLTSPAKLTQCALIARAPFDLQEEIAQALLARKHAPSKVLLTFAPRLAECLEPKKVKKKSEATFQGEVVLALQKRYGLRIYLERRNVGAVVTRDRSGNKTGVFKASSVVGAADYHGYLDGRPFEIEFKAAAGKQRDAQKAFEKRMEALGVPYFLFGESAGVETCLTAFDARFAAVQVAA